MRSVATSTRLVDISRPSISLRVTILTFINNNSIYI